METTWLVALFGAVASVALSGVWYVRRQTAVADDGALCREAIRDLEAGVPLSQSRVDRLRSAGGRSWIARIFLGQAPPDEIALIRACITDRVRPSVYYMNRGDPVTWSGRSRDSVAPDAAAPAAAAPAAAPAAASEPAAPALAAIAASASASDDEAVAPPAQ